MSSLYVMRPNIKTDGLCHLVKETGLQDFTIAEIGSFAGESAQIFLNGSAKKLYAIDLWMPITYNEKSERIGVRPHIAEAKFDQRLETWLSEGKDVVKLKMDMMDALSHVADHSLDLLYIDAEHTYEAVMAAVRAWLCKIKPGGFLAGHDYSSYHKPVMKAVDELAERFGPPRTFGDASWFFPVTVEWVHVHNHKGVCCVNLEDYENVWITP